MGIVVSWILKFTRFIIPLSDEVDENNRCVLHYNEVDAFYIFIHISENLDYRHIYDY